MKIIENAKSNKNNRKDENKRKVNNNIFGGILKKSFLNAFWIGVILLLITIILKILWFTELSNSETIINSESLKERIKNVFVLSGKSIFVEVLQTFSVSLLLAGLFTWISDTRFFTNKIISLLKTVVIKRDFLSSLDKEGKETTLQSIIKPSSLDQIYFENVNEYYDYNIKKMLDISSKNIRSDYHVIVTIFEEDRIVKYRTKISHRLYKNKEGFGKFNAGFDIVNGETTGKVVSLNIGTVNGISYNVDINNTDEVEENDNDFVGGVPTKTYTVDLDKIIENNKLIAEKYIQINTEFIENGYDHWVPIIFRALKPTCGFNYTVIYPDGFYCAKYMTYGDDINYVVHDNPEEKEVTVSTAQWVPEGAGLNIIISRKK